MGKSFSYRRRYIRRRNRLRVFSLIFCFAFLLLCFLFSWFMIGSLLIKKDPLGISQKVESVNDSIPVYNIVFEDDSRQVFERSDSLVKVVALKFHEVHSYEAYHDERRFDSDYYNLNNVDFLSKKEWKRALNNLSFMKQNVVVMGYNYYQKKHKDFFYLYHLTSNNYTEFEAVQDLKTIFHCDRIYVKIQ